MDSKMMTLALQPMDAPEAVAPPPKPSADIEILPVGKIAAPPSEPAEKADRFLTEATHQYAEGHLDQPLWDRAYAQANGNKEAAVEAYLGARAIALRLLDRERRSGNRSTTARVVRLETGKAFEPASNDVDEIPPVERRRAITGYRNAIIVGAIMVPLLVGGWLFLSRSTVKSTDAAGVFRTLPAATPANKNSVATSVATSVSNTGPGKPSRPTGASPELMQKIQDLRDAGSSNVLVLYLQEWTRKEPANADAWDQLRAGYVTLKQYDDALGAARKAVELASDDPRLWRNLGAANRDVGDSAAALLAFDQAIARNDRDVESLKQIGILNAEMSKLPEAGRAFEQALAISPGDPMALCLRSAVAQLSAAPKDSYAIARQVKAIETKCQG
jgi:tetratricopeptide (TPR) repeat protein